MSNQLIRVDWANMSLPDVIKQSGEVNTLPEILKLRVPTIGILSKQHSTAKIIDIIHLKILDVLEFFNLKTSMNDKQITQTAELILKAYYWITVSDITLCFENAKLGQYGKLYAAIDGQVILLWFKVYVADRANEAEDLMEREHNERKFKKTIFAPELGEAITEAYQVVEERKEAEKIERQNNITEFEKNVFDLFDKLHKEQGYPLMGIIRIVKIDGLNYNQEAFMKIAIEHFKQKNK